MSKTHWKKLTNPDYLGAYSLEPGQELNLTIKNVVRQQVTGADGKKEECTVAYFTENVKPMILNVTNCKTIQKLYDNPYIEDWSGKKVTIYATKVKAFGESVEALRIRNKIPEKQNLTPQLQPTWDDARKAFLAGNVTVDQIRGKYNLTKENEAILCKISE